MSFQICIHFFLLLNTKEDILKKVTKQVMVAIDFHSMGKNTMEVNGYQQMFGYQHSSKYLV